MGNLGWGSTTKLIPTYFPHATDGASTASGYDPALPSPISPPHYFGRAQESTGIDRCAPAAPLRAHRMDVLDAGHVRIQEDWFLEIPNTVTGDSSPIYCTQGILAHYKLHCSHRSGPYKGTLLHERRPAALLAAHALALELPCIYKAHIRAGRPPLRVESKRT